MNETIAFLQKEPEAIPILNEAKVSMKKNIDDILLLNEKIISYETKLSASEKKNAFLSKMLLELVEECDKGNNNRLSVIILSP